MTFIRNYSRRCKLSRNIGYLQQMHLSKFGCYL